MALLVHQGYIGEGSLWHMLQEVDSPEEARLQAAAHIGGPHVEQPGQQLLWRHTQSEQRTAAL